MKGRYGAPFFVGNPMSQEPPDDPIRHPDWTCPICKSRPQGRNFRIKIVETRTGLELFDWIGGDQRTGIFCAPKDHAISTADDFIGHITIFEGCICCLSTECEKNPLAKSFFKLAWQLLVQGKHDYPKHYDGVMHAKF